MSGKTRSIFKIKWSLYKMIILTCLFVALVSSIAGVEALIKMNGIKRNTILLTDEWIPKIIKSGEVNTNIALFRKSEWEYLNAKTKEEKSLAEDGIDAAYGNVSIYTKALSKLITEPNSQKIFDSYSGNWDKYSDLHDKFLTAAKANKTEEANKILNKDLGPLFNNMTEDLKKLSDANFQGSLNAKTESEKILINSRWMVGIISTVGLLFSLLISALVARSITKRIHNVIKKLEEGANLLNESTKHISSSSIKLSESVTEQVSALHETVASVDEINNKVNLNNQTTEKTLLASSTNIEVANQGVTNMNDVIQSITKISNGMEDLMDKIQESHKEIAGIVTIISAISEKTKVINDIVFQTRLLSFNASVEAARAGEQGKGFAVVAEEVGKLAQLSGNSASEISSLLQSSIEKVNEIVRKTADQTNSLVQINKAHIDSGNLTSRKCNDSLEKIIVNIKSVNEMINTVNVSSNEQGMGLKEISRAIGQLHEATNFNSEVANLTSKEATSLDVQVLELTKMVDELSQIV
jgi:methyl-accepting chemotaxis protein